MISHFILLRLIDGAGPVAATAGGATWPFANVTGIVGGIVRGLVMDEQAEERGR